MANLIDVDGFTTPGIIDVSASHAVGEIAPTFTVTFRPPRGMLDPFATHFAWTPPAVVKFTIAGTTWECVPGDAPRSVGNGVEYSIQYIPKPLYTLRHGSYKTSIAWLSCPQWQYEQFLTSYDEEEWTIFHKPSDVYASDGWTVSEVLVKIGELLAGTLGVTIVRSMIRRSCSMTA